MLKISSSSYTTSPMDPLQWMGGVRIRVQTADKNITHLSSPSIRKGRKGREAKYGVPYLECVLCI